MLINICQIAETVSTVLSIFAVYLDTKQKILARPVSLVSISIELIVYIQSRLYAKSILSIVFLVLNAYGWHKWKYGGANKSVLPISKLEPKQIVGLLIGGLVASLTIGYLLHTKTRANLAYWDSINAVFWLIAYVLLINKKLESWFFWFLLNVSFGSLCYYKGLYIFTIRFMLYLFLAAYGYRSWRSAYTNHSN